MCKSIKNRTCGAETFSIYFFLSVRKAVELRARCPGAGMDPREHPHLLPVGYPVTALLRWGRWRGWCGLSPARKTSRDLSADHPLHRSPPGQDAALSGSVPCQLSSDVCHYLLVLFTPCSRMWGNTLKAGTVLFIFPHRSPPVPGIWCTTNNCLWKESGGKKSATLLLLPVSSGKSVE